MKEKYGKVWRDEMTDLSVELAMYRQSLPGETRLLHFTNAQNMLIEIMNRTGKRSIVRNDWLDRATRAWCVDEFKPGDSSFMTWWGPSSAGKSTHAALIILTHWFAAPDETTVLICTTTADMLELKVWGEVERLYLLLGGGFPGKLYPGSKRILLGDENSKNGIFGIAVQRGDPIGVHNKYNCLVIDEMQDPILMGAADSIDNLATGEEFKFLGMGNPMSHFDPLGKYSEPTHGWNKINVDMDSWETKEGKCLHFDGEKSPAIKDPDKFYFLIKQIDLDKMKRRRGKESPRYMTFGRGFIPSEGISNTMFTESFLLKFQCMKAPDWKYVSGTFVVVDPSYSAGGDACMAQPFQVGETMDGTWCMAFLEPAEIHLDLSEGEPMVYYLADKVAEVAEKYGVKAQEMAADTTGVQGMFVDVLEKKIGKGVLRVNFQEKPSDLAVSTEDNRPAHVVYRNKVTELWSRLWEYCHAGQVRGLSVEAVKQLCARQMSEKSNRFEELETKKIFKGRYGRSPDNADACCIAAAYCRERLGIIPGGTFGMYSETQAEHDYAEQELDGRKDAFLTSEL